MKNIPVIVISSILKTDWLIPNPPLHFFHLLLGCCFLLPFSFSVFILCNFTYTVFYCMVHSQVLWFCITSSGAPKTCPARACHPSLQMTRDGLDLGLRIGCCENLCVCVSPKMVRLANLYQYKLSPACILVVSLVKLLWKAIHFSQCKPPEVSSFKQI